MRVDLRSIGVGSAAPNLQTWSPARQRLALLLQRERELQRLRVQATPRAAKAGGTYVWASPAPGITGAAERPADP
jgi:hypothetical protein